MRIILYLLLVLMSFDANSQVLSQRVSQSQIGIGQPVTINYIVDSKASDTLLFKEKTINYRRRL